MGKATGIEPLEKLGTELDNANRDLKNVAPPYKAFEEKSSEFVRKRAKEQCIAPYQAITNSVIAHCSNWDGRLDDQDSIRQAVGLLVTAELFQASEFGGIQIRWCPLARGHGMAPDRGRIYLDIDSKGDEPAQLAALLAHEMQHIRQYRRLGSDNFKCEYSRKLLEGGGCQDQRHPLEREAFNFQDNAYEISKSKVYNGSTITLCNKSSVKVLASLKYKKDGEWIAEGWWHIPSAQCKKMLSNVSGVIYSYATTDPWGKGPRWLPKGETAKFCIDSRHAFTNPDAYCEGAHYSDYRWAEMGILTEEDAGSITWNIAH